MRTAMRRAAVLSTGLVLAPLVIAATFVTAAHRDDFHPVGDMALAELRTRDVGRYALLVGPYSRDGWFHPGPTMFYAFALPYRLLGSTSTSLSVAALAIAGLSVVALAVLAHRRGGLPLLLVTMLGCALLLRSFGADQWRTPWNPFVTVLPFGVLVFLVWSLCCRDRWALPAAVVVTSFVAQTHILYLPLAVPLLLFGTAWSFVSALASRRQDGAAEHPARRLLWPSVVAVGVGALLWVGPVVDELVNRPGNVLRTLAWFRTGAGSGQATRGLAAAWRVVSAQYGLPPEWLIGSRGVNAGGEPTYLDRPLVPVLLVVVLAATALLWRRPLPGGRRLAAVWLVASAVGVAATSRTIGPLYSYRDDWASVLAMVAFVLVAWVAWRAGSERYPGLERRVLVPLSALVLVALAVASTVGHLRAGVVQGDLSARLAAVTPATVRSIPPGGGDVLVDGDGTGVLGLVYASGVALQLERQGIDVVLPSGDVAAGEHRTYRGGPLRARLVLATGDAIPLVRRERGLELVAQSERTAGPSALAVFLDAGAGDR